MGLFNPSSSTEFAESAWPLATQQQLSANFPRSDSATLTNIGDVVTSIAGTISALAATSTLPGGLSTVSGATTGNNCGWTTGQSPGFPQSRTVIFDTVVQFQQTTAQRIYCGLFDTNATDTLNNNVLEYAGFRYSTDAGDTNWMCVTSDNVSTDAQSSGVAFATSLFRLRIIASSASAKFYINGSLVKTLTTNLPTPTSGLFSIFGLQTRANAAKTMRWFGTTTRYSWS
jgi:hypothetical protein